MTMQNTQNQNHEQILIDIVRHLPINKADQLVEFACFLEAQKLNEFLRKDENIADVEEDNTRWDELMETDKAQALLDMLADEALEEYKSGKTKAMKFNKKGQIEPE